MCDIYKLNYFSEQKINKILVFCGKRVFNNYNTDELKKVFKKNPNDEIFQEIFTINELDKIKTNKIDVNFTSDFINGDTSIEAIKTKIKNIEKGISIDEIYLFSSTNIFYTDESIYSELLKYSNDDNNINVKTLKIFLSNLNIDNLSELLSRISNYNKISFDDIQDLELNNTTIKTEIALGQYSNKLIYNCNPYSFLSLINTSNLDIADIQNEDVNIISTLNKNLLLEYNIINNDNEKNNIGVIFTEEIVNNINKNDKIENKNNILRQIFRIYFPYLYKNNINDFESYTNYKKNYQKNSKKKVINESFMQNNNNLQLFYDISELNLKSVNYLKKGISNLHFRLMTQKTISIPNNILFKLLNSTIDIPCIKFNPGKEIENIYRLYSNKITNQNIKIPYLKKARVEEIKKNTIPKNSILFYVNVDTNTKIYIILLDDGNIDVKITLNILKNKIDVENILIEHLNNIIDIINKILNQSGQYINYFTSFNINCKILNIDYNYYLDDDYDIKIDKYIGCFSSIFNIKNTILKKEKDIELRYIKVSNYNEMDSKEAMIIDLLNINTSFENIKKNIMDSFNIKEPEAINDINRVINDNLLQNNKSNSSRFSYKNSPGFLIKINKDKNKNYKINVSKINNLNYLKYIDLYINVFLSVIKDTNIIKKKSAEIYNDFKLLCEKNDEVKIDEDVKEDINDGNLTLRPIDIDNNKSVDTLYRLLDELEEDEYEQDVEEEVKEVSEEEELLSDDEELEEELEEKVEDTRKKSVTFKNTPDIQEIVEIESKLEEKSEPEETVELQEKVEFQEKIEPEPKVEELEENVEPGPEIKESKSTSAEEVTKPKPIIIKIFDDEEDDEDDDDDDDLMIGGKKIALFCYGSNNEPQLKKRLKSKTIKIEKAYIKDYLRVFGNYSSVWNGAVSSLIKVNKNEKKICQGLVVYVTNKQLEMLDLYEGIKKGTNPNNKNDNMYRRSEVEIYLPNNKQQKILGITYIQNYPSWITHPSVEYLHSTCKTINKFWNELDNYNELYVYNDKEVLCGIYNENTKKYRQIQKMTGGAGQLTRILSDNFSKRLNSRAPEIFTKKIKKPKKLDDYVRSCNLNDDINNKITRRQPYILNEEELKDINPESYSGEPLEYTVNGNKNYFICPKYFNTKTKKPMSFKEIQDNNLQDFINKSKKDHDPNKYIIEMNIHNYAGFLKSGDKNKGTLKATKNEDDLCVPCCFTSYSTDTQNALKSLCKEDDKTLIQELTQNIREKHNYILSEETNPLPIDNIGKLQKIIQNLLNINYTKINIVGNEFPIDTRAIVRVGVEKTKNNNSTFLACMLKIYNNRTPDQKYKNRTTKIDNINDFKKYIINKLKIDKFITYNNGDLVNIFYNSKNKEDKNIEFGNEIIIQTIRNNTKQINKIINAFENFKLYIENDIYAEDYNYLYNIFSECDKDFFYAALNIIILEIKDIKNEKGRTNYNVELICPPNTSLNNNYYNEDRNSVILIKYNNNYEPLCEYEYNNNNTTTKKNRSRKNEIITKFNYIFDLRSKTINNNIQEFLLKIFKIGNDKCNPVLLKQTDYKMNLPYKKLENILNKYNINITKQIINFDNKVIFLYIESDDKRLKGYIPCEPSKIEISRAGVLESLLINDVLWLPYEETYNLLLGVKKVTNDEIYTNIKYQVEDIINKQEKIVGFITETNQFVPINEPTNVNNDYNIDILKNNKHHYKSKEDYLNREERIILETTEDIDRINYVKKIKLEKNFYNLFRNTIKLILGKLKYKKQKERLINHLKNEKITYKSKLNKVKKIIQEIIDGYVDFIEVNENEKNNIMEKMNDALTLCITNNNNCSENNLICLETKDKKCKMNIPIENLVNKENNEKKYINKISDELIRFTRITNFMFEDNYLSFSPTNYQLNNDEILLLENEIENHYKDKVKIQKSKYEINNTYDNVNPFGEILNINVDLNNTEP